jgi:signal peptidase I
MTDIRKPWLAVFLSKIFPGIGQFYNRQIIKGMLLFLIAGIILFVSTYIHYSLSFLEIPLCLYALKDAFESAAKINGTPERFLMAQTRFIRTFIILMIVFDSIPFGEFIKANIIQAFQTPSGSMLPTLAIGDHILIDKSSGTRAAIRRGDVVVFKYPEDPKKDFVKRVVAIGGDTIEEKSKVIYINRNALHESFAQHTDAQTLSPEPRDNFGPYTVPPNNYFVMGDNRDQSYDSRYWGYVPKENIEGKVLKIYWSWDTVNRRVRWNRIGKAIR